MPPIPWSTTKLCGSSPRTARIITKVLSSQKVCVHTSTTLCRVNTNEQLYEKKIASIIRLSVPQYCVLRRCHLAKRAFSTTAKINASPFINLLPPSRLGIFHKTLGSYLASIYPDVPQNSTPLPSLQSKEYTLVVVTESRHHRILLGRKLRGFGTGFYNSFGGHLDQDIDPTPSHGAVRELAEETNIHVPLDVMKEGAVGTLRFTFEDDRDREMIVNLFRVDLICESIASGKKSNYNEDCSIIGGVKGRNLSAVAIDPGVIRACDEIEPQWFDDWNDIPLHNMFADDSIWLTKILSSDQHLKFDGWFHFCPGGTDTNSIMHHHLGFRLIQ